ncbi:serine protease inhibitor 88Ea-like [Homalodisca vitripennis]|uniref:serine protease inhibitor 88Ea-like n=1 Tax=Homalodisca vitripennis TaxID=197043 RepID=UPI001EEC3006|nr:serine protease inhibitor 88Ea-like [Homalodisca vitripennis]
MVRSTSVLVLVLVLVLMLVHPAILQCVTGDDANMKFTEDNRLQLLDSEMQFSLELLQKVNSLHPSENIFLSPSSVYNALLLAYFVSANHTEASMKQALYLPENQDKLDTIGAYQLEKYYQKLRAFKNSLNYQLSSANRMFISNEQNVRPCMMRLFNDEIEIADFTNNLTATVGRINSWVSGETRNNINDLLSSDSLTSNTNLVLVNAAYFRGLWKNQFSPSDTKETEFKTANGTNVPVMMMSIESEFSHLLEEKLEADVLELPYEGDNISLFILMPLDPSPTAIQVLLNKTDANILRDIINRTYTISNQVSVAIPKFSSDQSLELTPVLESMGIGDLFESSADLSTLTGAPGLRLDSVIHKAKITVDEEGTEASAATAIFANRFAVNSFIANRPFVYFLLEKKLNMILFVGVFNSPET